MKKAAYVLFVLQILSLYGNITEYSKMGVSYLNILFGSGIPFLIGNFFPTILGIIFLIRHANKQHKNDVIYYCDTCKVTREYEGGKQRNCLNCRRPLLELPILASEWNKLSAKEQEQYLAQVPREPLPEAPDPEPKKPLRKTRDLPAKGQLPLGNYFHELKLHGPEDIYYDAEQHAVMKKVHLHENGMSVWGYHTIPIPKDIQTLKELLEYLRQMKAQDKPAGNAVQKEVRDLPAKGMHSLSQLFPECSFSHSHHYDAQEHAIKELRHFHSDGQSVWGYSTIRKVPETIQTRKALLDFLKQSQTPAEESRLTLTCRENQRTFQATGSSVLVGRQADCALTFEGADWQKNLSRHHARFTFRNGSWYLEDLESLNGTKVNQQRLTPNQPVCLQPWDVIQFSVGDQLWFDLPLDEIREHTIW